MTDQKYMPGVCNIGPYERQKRFRSGTNFLILSLVIFVLNLLFELPVFVQLLAFIFAFSSAVGFLQYYLHFCAYFGILNVYNFENQNKQSKVTNEQYKIQDQLRSVQIIFLAFVIAVTFTLLIFLFPKV